MTIDKQGFLSPEIAGWIERHRAANKAWFDLANELNEITLTLLGIITVPSGENQPFAGSLLYMRGLSNFQGAMLLAERGMTQEARAITRGIFEAVFFLGAVCKAPEPTIAALIADDGSRRTKIARALVGMPGDSGLRANHIEKLEQFLSDQAKSDSKSKEFSVFEAARAAGLIEIYDVFYRGLSNDAAHPSITSLNRHVDANEKGEIVGLTWGPDVPDVEDTISSACTRVVKILV
jgi:Family of unknown function (DUF5677)